MSPKKRNQKLLGYTRVSRMKEDGISPELQRSAIEAYATAHGHEVVWLEPDLDESGKSLNRPSMQDALRRLERGEADGIIAARLDRITRKVADLGRLLEQAQAQDWNLVAIDLGVDLTTANGKMVANILGTLAEWELDRRREGWREAQASAAKRGVQIGTVPAGYSKGDDGRLVPNQYAPHIRKAFELRAAGKSLTEIGNYLRESGVPSDGRRRKSDKGSWSVPGVKSLLANKSYLGRTCHGGILSEVEHEAIIDQGLFKRVQRVNLQPGRTRKASRGDRAPALLQGIVKCATCGGPMSRDTSPRKDGGVVELYRCKGVTCTKRPVITLAHLDTYVASLVADLESGLIPTDDRGEDVKALEEELQTVEGEIEEAVEAFATAGVSPALQAQALAQLEGRKADVEQRLSEAETTVPFEIPAELAKQMKATPRGIVITGDSLYTALVKSEAGNGFLKQVLDRVVVSPGRGAPYERAEVIFKL